MKLKSLATMAVAVMFATPLAYAAGPTTLASDDMSNMNTPPTSESNIGSPNGGSGDNMPSANGTQATNDMQGAMPGAGTPNSTDSSNTNDDMSADTATGDDDY